MVGVTLYLSQYRGRESKSAEEEKKEAAVNPRGRPEPGTHALASCSSEKALCREIAS